MPPPDGYLFSAIVGGIGMAAIAAVYVTDMAIRKYRRTRREATSGP